MSRDPELPAASVRCYEPDMAVSESDRDYMRRLAAFKEESHREAQARHLALPIEERLRRSWKLYLRFRSSVARSALDDDPTPFYDRARALGLYRG